MPEPLRVAMVAPPWFDIPPQAYGGIESMIADLATGLIERGHEVTIIGAGHNGTPARFLRTLDAPRPEQLGEPFPEVLHIAKAARLLADLDVDVVHDHTLSGPLLAIGRKGPTVVTMHGPSDGELADYYRALGDAVSLVAISNAQRARAPDLNWAGMVYNGIRVADYPFQERKDDFLLFVGRFTPAKGPHLAIDAARAAGWRLLLAGKLNEPPEHEYFDAEIAPRLGPDVRYVGEADADGKRRLFANAACLLFPIQWEEPFGLVMVEAMACGTPVVALEAGSVPEVIAEGRTGVVCAEPAELPDAIERAVRLNPADCREHVARNFDLDVMAAGYEEVYRRLTGAG